MNDKNRDLFGKCSKKRGLPDLGRPASPGKRERKIMGTVRSPLMLSPPKELRRASSPRESGARVRDSAVTVRDGNLVQVSEKGGLDRMLQTSLANSSRLRRDAP